jgi:hypothetical protein
MSVATAIPFSEHIVFVDESGELAASLQFDGGVE